MGRLDGKRALVSGTGGGIGRATALLLAREGAHVVGCDLNEQTSAETVALARAAGGRMDAVAPARLAGRLVMRGEPGYEQARVGRIFNARRPDRFPAAVLQAASDDDVIEGVRLAGERGWPVSVRSGGHSWAAWSLRDDALLIDLGNLRDIGYDPATGAVTARPAVQGGSSWRRFWPNGAGRFLAVTARPSAWAGSFSRAARA